MGAKKTQCVHSYYIVTNFYLSVPAAHVSAFGHYISRHKGFRKNCPHTFVAGLDARLSSGGEYVLTMPNHLESESFYLRGLLWF